MISLFVFVFLSVFIKSWETVVRTICIFELEITFFFLIKIRKILHYTKTNITKYDVCLFLPKSKELVIVFFFLFLLKMNSGISVIVIQLQFFFSKYSTNFCYKLTLSQIKIIRKKLLSSCFSYLILYWPCLKQQLLIKLKVNTNFYWLLTKIIEHH